jgi:hypothetical protein
VVSGGARDEVLGIYFHPVYLFYQNSHVFANFFSDL